MQKYKVITICISVAVAGFLFLLLMEQVMRPYATKGLYFNKWSFFPEVDWSSESLMQTVPIEPLRDEPLRSILNIHIQPPALDTIRAILAYIWYSPDTHMSLWMVDRSLLILWAIIYALAGSIIFWWLLRLTNPTFACLSALLFLLHPASILYATLLDSTFLTALLILWTYYALWRIHIDKQASVAMLAIAVLSLFFTRSLFQLPSVLIFACSLALLKVPIRKIIIFMALAAGIAGLYIVKQYYQFGLTATSSLSGYNLCNSIGYRTNYFALVDTFNFDKGEEGSLPRVLFHRRKFNGMTNYNHIKYVEKDKELITEYKKRLFVTPVSQLFKTYKENFFLYVQPSSWYTENILVSILPGRIRAYYDRFFSYPYFLLAILLAAISWIVRNKKSDYISGVALLLPGLYIFLASILFEKGENMRFKFFLEPVLFVFIASEVYCIYRGIVGSRLSSSIIRQMKKACKLRSQQ